MGSSSASSRRIRSRVSAKAPRPAARPSQGRPWPPWGAANAVSVGAPLHAPGDGRLFLEGLFHQGEDGVGALGQADGGRHARLTGFLGGFLLLLLGGTG